MPVQEYVEDIFTSPVQTLVNPVNCAGAMGAGLALQFRERVPGLYETYRKLCWSKQLTINKLWRYKWPGTHQQVICFPTKKHWSDHANRDAVIYNLHRLVELRERLQIESLAIPLVGCGLGNLSYETDLRGEMLGILGTMGCEVRVVMSRKGK